MEFLKTFAVACALLAVAAAQAPDDALSAKIAGVLYPVLAEQARIQGDVRLNLESGNVTLLSGHTLLAPIAVENAKAFGSIQGGEKIEVTYHFVLDTPPNTTRTSVTVKRGDAFDRVVLRMFGLKTEKVVVRFECTTAVLRASDFKITGAAIEIWVHGRDHCVETQATLVAKR